MRPFHNARFKRYPDGSGELLIGSRPFGGGECMKNLPAFLDDGEPPFTYSLMEEEAIAHDEFEYAVLERAAIETDGEPIDRDANAAACHAASIRRSVRRAKKAVRDIARSNDWTYFVTLTLDPDKVDRYSVTEVWKHLRHWLGNNVRRKGLIYLLVLEHHKDGALHAHGLFNDALEAVDSGTMSLPGRKAPVKVRSQAQKEAFERIGGHVVYNLPSWGWGFSTAIKLYGEKDAAISYVCKYIGKEMTGADGAQFGTPEKIGGRWYYSGGDLQRPTVEWFDVDIRDWEGTPGWFQPEDYPYASFLSMRVTAEGEILPPYVRKVEENKRSGEDVSRETISHKCSDAEHVRGSEPAPQGAGHDCPGPSSGHDAGSPLSFRGGVSCAGFPTAHGTTLTAPRTARNLGNFSHLTNSGLSSQPGPPGEEWVQLDLLENDRKIFMQWR